jgi:hypothetical protein
VDSHTLLCSRCGQRNTTSDNFCPRCALPVVDMTPVVKPRVVHNRLALGIVFLPYIFAWFTLRRGHSILSRALSFTWFGVFMVGNLWASIHPATVERNQTLIGNSQLTITAKASPTKAATLPPAGAWTTKDSRDTLGAFFIKPYLRQWLKDPDSLQDFEVVNATPNKKLPGSLKVTVFYRARNSFGALVPEQRTVTMVYNSGNANRPWVMVD